MRQLQPKTGESLAVFFQNTNTIVFVLFIFLLFDLLYQRGYQRQYFWRLKLKSVGLWGRYGLKQCNTLQHFKITIQIVSVLSPVLLFYLKYQKICQRYNILILNQYVSLWRRYSLKQENPLQFFKTQIKLYFLCLFLYSLTSCIK